MSIAGVEHHDGVPVVRPRADVDAANAAALREQLADCVDSTTDRLVIDLSETRYIDSAGLDMLFRLSELLRQRRTRLLVVIAPESHLARLAEIVGLSRSMAIHPSLQDALGAEAQPLP
jgi:anti-anti-sigma factor